MIYLHKFNTVQEFEESYNSSGYTQPWVGVVERTEEREPVISYNKWNANGYDYVDLGLPSGNLWATMNVGAYLLTDSGSTYAWGEITPKASYSWDNYKYGTSYSALTKYNTEDNIMDLLPEDDVAHVVMGGDWVMPTVDDVDELWTNTQYSFQTINGNLTVKCTSKLNGNYILFPTRNAAGEFSIWSSTVYSPSVKRSSHCLSMVEFSKRMTFSLGSSDRFYGKCVRGIIKTGTNEVLK